MFVTLVLGTVSAVFLYFYFKKRPNPTIPEAKYGLPIVGHLPIMLFRLGKKSQWEWRKSAPTENGPLIQLRFFSSPMVMVGDADAAKAVLNDPNIIRDPIIQNAHAGVAKYGLFILPGGDVWKMHRKFIQPAFAPSHLKHAFELSIACVQRLKNIWDKKLEGKEYIIEEMHNVATRMAGDIIGEMAFAYNLNLVNGLETKNESEKYFIAMESIAKVLQKRFYYPEFTWDWAGLGHSMVQQHVELIHSLIQTTMAAKLDKLKSQKDASLFDKDLLDRLLMGKEENRFTEEEIFDEAYAFFFAGHETTANTLTWALVELGKDKYCQVRLQKEIDLLFEKDGGITWENMNSPKYLDCVIKETLRLHPVGPAVSRKVVDEPTTILGHAVEVGSAVIVDILSIHLNEKYWPNPFEFQPDRFLDNEKLPKNAYYPFGDGPMSCIGQKMALIELKVMIAFLLRHYHLDLISFQDLTPVFAITMGLKDGVSIKLRKRK